MKQAMVTSVDKRRADIVAEAKIIIDSTWFFRFMLKFIEWTSSNELFRWMMKDMDKHPSRYMRLRLGNVNSKE